MDTEEKKTSLEESIKRFDKEITEFAKHIGAKNHKFNINVSVIFNIPFPISYSIEIEFEDGRTYGQSATTFGVCFKELCQWISFDRSKNNN